jgi:hypothetical protein
MMGVVNGNSTLPGGMTPVCNVCGVHLCWDISQDDYRRNAAFWNAWICRDCNGGEALSLSEWRRQRRDPLDRPGWHQLSELGRLL